MDFEEFENFIGKKISYADELLSTEGFENNELVGIITYSLDGNYKDFYGMPYNMISIIKDNNDIVKEVTIHFRQIIDDSFYNEFIGNYDKPNTIQVVNSVKSVGEWQEGQRDNEIDHRTRKVTLEMREGRFEENPLFMIWNKGSYQIKALLRYEQSISEITFRLPSKNL